MSATLLIPQLPETAPFSAEQRSWLNGYVAGLYAQTIAFSLTSAQNLPALALPAGPPPEPLLIAYGSQTGTAEGLARKVAKAAKARNFLPEIVALEACQNGKLTTASKLLVVTSTYGDGDPPDNAEAFWKYLQSDEPPALTNLQYSVLSLGDTNYEKFCEFGKACDLRLEALGAKRMWDRVDCDLDYEAPAATWMEQALNSLSASGADATLAPAVTESDEPSIAETGYSKKNPFPAQLLVNRLLNAPGSGKQVRHFEISLANSGLVYEAGDALGIYPSNSPELVADILAALQLTDDDTLRQSLLTDYDLGKPSHDFLTAVAQQTGDTSLTALLAPERRAVLNEWLYGRDILDVLLASPDLRFSATDFLGLLRKLAPRLYSISSSPKAHPGEVHLTVATVLYESYGRGKKGVCSTFLAERCQAETPLPVFVQPSHGFRVPADGDKPMIMIGPGTGIAPFRAFLEERQATGAKGKNWLFFGDQKRATDFYYEDQLTALQKDGILTRLDTAFSRDQAEKIYVQTRMTEHGGLFWNWLEDGAHVYVCGDASRMAKDVDLALHALIIAHGHKTPDEAAAYVADLKKNHRYQRDVY